MHVVDCRDGEMVWIRPCHNDYLLTMRSRVDFIDGGHKESILVLSGVAFGCREFEDDRVVVFEIMLSQKLVVVWFNFRLDRSTLLINFD